MVDSQSRLPCCAKLPPADRSLERTDWEEATFTRPMRSPFAASEPPPIPAPRRASTPPPRRASKPKSRAEDVDVALEESALFERDTIRRMPAALAIVRPALQGNPTEPPRPRPSRLPKPKFDNEATTKRPVPFDVLHAMRSNFDSVRLRAADPAPEPAVDLSRTVEEPAIDPDASRPRRRR